MSSGNSRFRTAGFILLTAGLLTACGGGGFDESASAPAKSDGTTPISTGDTERTGASGASDTGVRGANSDEPAGTGESQSDAGTSGGGGSESPSSQAAATSFATEMLAAINARRSTGANCGGQAYAPASPLSWDGRLEQAALGHSEAMRDSNSFSHTGPDNSTVGTRVSATGYVWSAVGENIAAGYPSVAAVIQAWMSSPGHCRNIMSTSYTQTGVAMVAGTNANTYANYWTMVLARPR